MIEADFCQFYNGADLRDFWRSGSGMTYRWVVSHIRHLPEDSRYVNYLRSESGFVWDRDDHHRQDMVDLLQQAVYFLQTGPIAELKNSDRQKVIKGAPKRIPRPGEAEQEKPRMSTKQELRNFFGG